MVLAVEHVHYAYSSQRNKQILNDISIKFEEGLFYSIVGASGTGKTTLLSLLAGLDVATSGKILYHGEDIQKQGLHHHRKKQISLVFQNYNLIDYLTTFENVKLGGRKDPAILLEKVAISPDDWHRNVLQLSGGQQQRVAIARALASDAEVLLADEPTGNLDEQSANEIIALLKQSAHELRKCVIVVTHSASLAKQADIILQMDQGNIFVKAALE